jgi:hypothetical protein
MKQAKAYADLGAAKAEDDIVKRSKKTEAKGDSQGDVDLDHHHDAFDRHGWEQTAGGEHGYVYEHPDHKGHEIDLEQDGSWAHYQKTNSGKYKVNNTGTKARDLHAHLANHASKGNIQRESTKGTTMDFNESVLRKTLHLVEGHSRYTEELDETSLINRDFPDHDKSTAHGTKDAPAGWHPKHAKAHAHMVKQGWEHRGTYGDSEGGTAHIYTNKSKPGEQAAVQTFKDHAEEPEIQHSKGEDNWQAGAFAGLDPDFPKK